MKNLLIVIVIIQTLVIAGCLYFSIKKSNELERYRYEAEKALEIRDQELRDKMTELEAVRVDLMRLHEEVEECSRNGFYRK